MNPAITKKLTGYQTPESSRTVYVSRKRRIYASVSRVSIGSDNGLSLIRRQAIIEANAGLFSLGPVGTNFSEIKLFIHENADEIIVCEMAAILSRRRWVNGYTHIICATWYDYCSILTADGLLIPQGLLPTHHPHPPTHTLPTTAYTTLVPKVETHPLSLIFDEKNAPFSTEIADFEAQ